MVAYELYTFDKINGYELIGVLPERRRKPERINKGSVINWGRKLLGSNADGKDIFIKKITFPNSVGKKF